MQMTISDIDTMHAYIWTVKSYVGGVKSFPKRLYNQDFFPFAFISLRDVMVCFDIKSELAAGRKAFIYSK